MDDLPYRDPIGLHGCLLLSVTPGMSDDYKTVNSVGKVAASPICFPVLLVKKYCTIQASVQAYMITFSLCSH